MLGLGVAVLCLTLTVAALAEPRFPPPDFESGHKLPVTTTPAARAVLLQYLDVAVLAACLGVGTWLVYRPRSRKGLVALSIFSLLYFGFWKKGCVCAIGSVQNVTLGLCDRGYAVPLVAAGANLSFWPLGPFLRRCGAFFLRRSFKGDPIYSESFQAYVRKLVHDGVHQEFFPEGGRSRTGKLLPAKLGLLGWEVEAVLEGDAIAVARVLEWMRHGPPQALVTKVHTTEEAPLNERGFAIR